MLVCKTLRAQPIDHTSESVCDQQSKVMFQYKTVIWLDVTTIQYENNVTTCT
jgi:hypothetical protein